MKIEELDSKLKKRVAIGFALILLFLGSSLLISKKISGIVEGRIYDYLDQQDSLLYNVSFKTLRVNLLTGSIKFDSIQFIPNETLLSDSVKGFYKGEIASVQVQNISYSNFLFKHKISLGKLKIDGSQLSYYPNNHYVKKAKKERVEGKDFFGDQVTEIEVGIVEIINANMKKYKSDVPKETDWSINNMWVQLKQLHVDSGSIHNEPPFSFSALQLGGDSLVSQGSDFYDLWIDDLYFDSKTQELSVDGFGLKPKYSRKQFSRKLKHEDDMFDVSLKTVKMSGFNLQELLVSKHLHVASIAIDSPMVSIYRDKRVVDGPYKHKPLMTTSIKKIPVSTQVSSIVLTNGKLTYEEKQSDNNLPGLIFFDLEKININNVCNITAEINKSPVMEMDVKAKIMGKASLEAQFDFLLSCASDSFYVEGKLDKTPASVFNPMTKNLMNVKIESGTINSAFFSFLGTDDVSSGSLMLDYVNLKVGVVKSDDRKNALFSAGANSLVQNDNVTGNQKYRKGYIYYKRDKNKGFPNYLWKSISSALVPIVAPLAESKEHKLLRKEQEAIRP